MQNKAICSFLLGAWENQSGNFRLDPFGVKLIESCSPSHLTAALSSSMGICPTFVVRLAVKRD
jgi:hypothetical protein